MTRQSFGAGMPGALALESPEIAHWLQEQELEFDLTLIVADATDLDFATEAIEEADEVLFIAGGDDAGLSPLERHALEARGAANCRLVFQKGSRQARSSEPPNGWSRAATAVRRPWTSPRPPPSSSWARGLRARDRPSPLQVPAFTPPRFWARCRPWRSMACRPYRWRRPEVPSCPPAFWRAESLGRRTRFSRNSPTRCCGSARPGRKRASSIPFRSTISWLAPCKGWRFPPPPALCRRLAFAFGGRGRGTPHRQAARRGAGRHRSSGHAAAAHCRGRRHSCQR